MIFSSIFVEKMEILPLKRCLFVCRRGIPSSLAVGRRLFSSSTLSDTKMTEIEAASASTALKLKSLGLTGQSGLHRQRYDDVESDYTDTPQYPPEVAPFYQISSEAHFKERRKILAEIVRNLPTVQEKIDFVNPYERPWRDTERHRHRIWQRPLNKPRKSYLLSPVPHGYNSLGLYKHVTNTHCIQGLPDLYEKVEVNSSQTEIFKARILELLKSELKGRQNLEKSIDSFIDQLANHAVTLFAHDIPHLKDCQVGSQVRYESFIERSGFKHLYKDWTARKYRLTGDSVFRLGELSFCFKDTAQIQFRSDLSLKPIVDQNDEICSTEVPKFEYYPRDFNTVMEEGHLWMVPGFEYGETSDFGHLMINNMKNLEERLTLWQAEPEERDECLLSMAMSSCFSWLNAQAHYKGFTQLNDITYPFVTQAVFTNGQHWYFACYQLNTLDLMYDFDAASAKDGDQESQQDSVNVSKSKKPPYANLCWTHGPLKLYESFDSTTGHFSGVSDDVITLLLKFLKNQPIRREDVLDFTPYVAPVVKVEDQDEDIIQMHIKEAAAVKYTT